MDEQNVAVEQATLELGAAEETVRVVIADEIPSHWRMVRLGDVFLFTKKPKDVRYIDFNQIPFVPMELVPIGKLHFNNYTLRSADDLSSGTYFEPGDVLIAKITPSFENGKQGIIESLPTPFGIATTEV